MRIAIIYDPGGEDWTAADVEGVLRSVNQIAGIFGDLGHEVRRVPVKHDLRWFAACRKADLVFNLCEGVHGVSRWEDHVVAALEFAGIPFTGAGPWTLAACRRKAVTNALLADAGLPVPRWLLADGPVPEDFPLPAIVKPACEDASAGLDGTSVVTDRKALKARLAQMTERFDEVLVQAYVAGREFNVGIVGERVLPIAEIDYSGMPEGAWPILTYGAKWDAGSPEDLGSRPVCPAVVPARLADRMVRVAQAAWRVMQGKGYGRVDLRVDAAGQPWIIDVNPNPDLDDAAGLSRMARVSGWSYADLCRRLAELALADSRGKRAAARLLRGSARLPKEQHA
jgi:D-alanine-D-alanine ligase